MDLVERLRRLALDAGAAGFGVADAAPFTDTRADLEQRKALQFHGGMSFTWGDPARATDVSTTHPWARRLVVIARAYLPEAGRPEPPDDGTGRVARFATQDHYRPLRATLDAVGDVLRGEGHRASVLCDDNRLVDRAAAVRAGVGWWGKNTMVLRPREGPWTLLGSVVTDAELAVTPPMRRDCGTCDACLPACPTGALVAPGVLDARRCLAHLLQSPDPIPRPLREAVGDRLYGCDDCLEACPPGRRLMDRSLDRVGRVVLFDILQSSDAALLERFGHFYIPRRRPDHLRRNALVALGNVMAGMGVASGAGDASGEGDGSRTLASGLEILGEYLRHPEAMLRAHAAWALGRIGDRRARAMLEASAPGELDPEVRSEIDAALADMP